MTWTPKVGMKVVRTHDVNDTGFDWYPVFNQPVETIKEVYERYDMKGWFTLVNGKYNGSIKSYRPASKLELVLS